MKVRSPVSSTAAYFQIDLRDDAATVEKLAKNKQKPLSLEMGEKLAKELRAVKYVECSALTQVTADQSFGHFLSRLSHLADSFSLKIEKR